MDEPLALEANASAAVSRASAKREAGLRATLQHIILSDGFARLSVSEMAQRLGCSKRTIYELAPTKNELVLQIITMFFEQLRAEAAVDSMGDDDPAVQIFEYLQVGIRAAQRLGPVAIADIDKWEPARRIWQEHIELRVEGLRALIERGIESGNFRAINPTLVAEMVFAGLSRLRDPNFYRSTGITASDAFEQYYKLLLYALVDTDSAR